MEAATHDKAGWGNAVQELQLIRGLWRGVHATSQEQGGGELLGEVRAGYTR